MIRILTDSASDILPAEAEQLGVTVIPLNVTLEDGSILRDGIDMTPTEYYAHLASCRKLPTTSQPSPELFEKFYLEAAAAGDEVLGIFLSHELSGTWQCAKLAADLANVDNVLFVDSATVCLGESLLVRLAVQLRDAGKTLVQIATDLEHAKEHLHLVAAIDDLKYLRKGGRLPAAVAVAGGMLGIKPLITIKDGKVAMAGKARGLPGAYVALFKKIEELGGISPDFAAVAGYSSSLREVQPIENYFRENLHMGEPLVRQIGCVIGTHAGPGAFGLAFFDKGLELESATTEQRSSEQSRAACGLPGLFFAAGNGRNLPQSKPDGFASSLGEGASGAPGAHSTASEMSLPSSSANTTSIMGRMKRAPFFRAKWDPSRLPRMLLTAQGMPMWNTTRPFIR